VDHANVVVVNVKKHF